MPDKITELREFAICEKKNKDNFTFQLYTSNENDDAETTVRIQDHQGTFQKKNLNIYVLLQAVANEMDTLKKKTTSSIFPRIRFANTKMIDQCCDVAKNAADRYFEYQKATFEYVTAKRNSNSGTEVNQEALEQQLAELRVKEKAAFEAIGQLDTKARTLPSYQITKKAGLAMIALGLALFVGGIICVALSIGSAIFAPHISAILTLVGAPSVVGGATLAICGAALFASRHEQKTGMDNMKKVSTLLKTQAKTLSNHLNS